MTHVVLFGARGMLGTDLVATTPDDVRMDAFGRSEVDVADAEAVGRVLDDARPDWVVNAAAYTEVDAAETDFRTALAVNGTAVTRLGELCASRGVRVVHFGSDYVFSGRASRPYQENDAVEPLNAYGRTKLAGERGLIESGARSLILRTQWLYGLHGKSFPRTMWNRATKGARTRVVDDQVGRPTYTVDLARAVWELIRRDVLGLYHLASAGEPATWFDVAAAVFSAAGMPTLVSACTTADYPTPAVRPAYSVLDTARLTRETGIGLPPWRDGLTRFLQLVSADCPLST